MKGFKSKHPPKSDYYRLPWSKNDNPIGWLEVTDSCNLYCKGCYREKIEGHKTLKEIKKEILFLKKWRNCDNISIAGGEPLIHPDIDKIVEFIAENNIKPVILTNGIALNKKRLKELKKSGLAGLTIHIDSLQDRPGWKGKDEKELNKLRQHYAEMAKEVKGIYCSFNSTVYYDTFKHIPAMVEWANKNIDKVHGMIFITYRGIPLGKEAECKAKGAKVDVKKNLPYKIEELSEINIMSTDVYTIIKNSLKEYEPSGYLGGTASHDSYKWFNGALIGSKKKIYGSIGKKTMELIQTFNHILQGTYIAYPNLTKTCRKIFLMSMFDKSVRKAFANFIKNPLNLFRRVHLQSIAIIQAPDLLPDGGQDMCDSCPDMTFYDGKLINSCRLEEYRKYGGFMDFSYSKRR
ncbi:radical SAM protein [Candidatus Woesearchaeota archaeon]|nr:radical SAM protein [Candidatus Woesearchaeota archaeon]